MTMLNSETENFEKLRKLLTLKRHEQPPPRYFHNFSNNVLARLNASEGDSESQWLLNFWHGLMQRPVLSGALGASAFGLLLFGLVYSQGNVTPNTGYFAEAPFTASAPGSDKAPATVTFFNQFTETAPEAINSTNPVTSTEQPSLFNSAGFNIQRISYQTGGK
jgi:hypothetical protein